MDHAGLIDTLEGAAARIERAVAGLGAEQLRCKPSASEFSILENVAHIRDLEMQATSPRIRRIVAETNPFIENFDGAAVAAAANYNAEDFERAFEAFATQRRSNVDFLRGLDAASFERPARFVGVPATMLTVLGNLRAHDEEHLKAIEDIASQAK